MLHRLTKDEYENTKTVLAVYNRAECKELFTIEVPCITTNCDRCYILFPHREVHVDKSGRYCAYSHYTIKSLMKRMQKLLDYTVKQGFVSRKEIINEI